MAHYIDKDSLVAEIVKIRKALNLNLRHDQGVSDGLYAIQKYINTLEVRKVETWHLQEKEDIYDAVKDWGLYTFVCIMKDGTVQRFNGYLDEDCEGHINVHIDGVNDDYDNVDDIVKWIELT